MAVSSIQDRTNEFRSVLTQVQRRHTSSKVGAQRQSLLTDSQKAATSSTNGDAKPRRSEFARRAAEIGRGIGATMGKLEKLAERMNPGRLRRTSLTDILQWLNGKRCSTTGPWRSMS
jgi:syntaxin 5